MKRIKQECRLSACLKAAKTARVSGALVAAAVSLIKYLAAAG